MLHTVRNRLKDERGFTLVELLVVILIIGILAAIALPSFLGQRTKAQDSEAKSNARNLVSHVESCYADTQDYQACNTKAELGNTGLNLVDATPADKTNQVAVTAATVDTFTITAESKSGASFTMVKGTDGTLAGPNKTT